MRFFVCLFFLICIISYVLQQHGFSWLLLSPLFSHGKQNLVLKHFFGSNKYAYQIFCLYYIQPFDILYRKQYKLFPVMYILIFI